MRDIPTCTAVGAAIDRRRGGGVVVARRCVRRSIDRCAINIRSLPAMTWASNMLLLGISLSAAAGRRVIIQTEAARRDIDGNYIDAHDGKILFHNGTYFLYGEAYGNQTLVRQPTAHSLLNLCMGPLINIISSVILVHRQPHTLGLAGRV